MRLNIFKFFKHFKKGKKKMQPITVERFFKEVFGVDLASFNEANLADSNEPLNGRKAIAELNRLEKLIFHLHHMLTSRMDENQEHENGKDQFLTKERIYLCYDLFYALIEERLNLRHCNITICQGHLVTLEGVEKDYVETANLPVEECFANSFLNSLTNIKESDLIEPNLDIEAEQGFEFEYVGDMNDFIKIASALATLYKNNDGLCDVFLRIWHCLCLSQYKIDFNKHTSIALTKGWKVAVITNRSGRKIRVIEMSDSPNIIGDIVAEALMEMLEERLSVPEEFRNSKGLGRLNPYQEYSDQELQEIAKHIADSPTEYAAMKTMMSAEPCENCEDAKECILLKVWNIIQQLKASNNSCPHCDGDCVLSGEEVACDCQKPENEN